MSTSSDLSISAESDADSLSESSESSESSDSSDSSDSSEFSIASEEKYPEILGGSDSDIDFSAVIEQIRKNRPLLTKWAELMNIMDSYVPPLLLVVTNTRFFQTTILI